MKIAISGKLSSGKTTTAKFLKNLNKEFIVFNFAGRLKEIASELFNYDDMNKDRKFLQDFGGAIRNIDKNAWINSLDKRTKNLKYIIIDDLRMPNEYKYVKNNGYITIRLNISPEVQLERIKKLYPNNWEMHLKRKNHETEIALDDYEFDYILNSNDDITKILKLIYKDNIKKKNNIILNE